MCTYSASRDSNPTNDWKPILLMYQSLWYVLLVVQCVVQCDRRMRSGISARLFIFFISRLVEPGTARTWKDKTRSSRQNTNRNPRWSSQVSFQTAHLKRDLDLCIEDFDFHFDDHGSLFFLGSACSIISPDQKLVWTMQCLKPWMAGHLHVGHDPQVLLYRIKLQDRLDTQEPTHRSRQQEHGKI